MPLFPKPISVTAFFPVPILSFITTVYLLPSPGHLSTYDSLFLFTYINFRFIPLFHPIFTLIIVLTNAMDEDNDGMQRRTNGLHLPFHTYLFSSYLQLLSESKTTLTFSLHPFLLPCFMSSSLRDAINIHILLCIYISTYSISKHLHTHISE